MNKENSKKLTVLIVIVIIVSLCVAVLCTVLMITERNSNEKISKYIDDQLALQAEALATGSEYIEDGYKIDDEYEIKSTTAISDAYISGDTSALSEDEAKTLELASAVLDEIITPDMTTNYAKELAIYDWMIDNLKTGSPTTLTTLDVAGADAVSTPLGVLSGRSAVCVGYATTFRLFVNMLGMDCHIAHNDYHSWDEVQLDDGEWYFVDIYSDMDNVRYDNFNMTQSMCLESHDWDTSALPTAEGTQYTYAAQNCQDLDDITQLPYKFYKKLKKANKGFSLYYRIPNITTELAAEVEAYVTAMNSALMSSTDLTDFMDDYIYISWVPYNETDSIAHISFVHYTYEDDVTGVDDATANQIYSLVNDAFGTDLTYEDSDYSYTEHYYEDELEDGTVTGGEEEYIESNEIDDADPMYADEDGQ